MNICRIVVLLCLCLTSAAFGKSVQILVTPGNLEFPAYRFSVETANTTDGWTTFQVKIVAKTADLPADAQARLAVVTKTIIRGGGQSYAITKFDEVRVELEKAARTWDAKFTVSQEVLKKPGFSFLFEVTQGPASADFYIVKLQDFRKD
jgi:hypothetical protein